MSIQQPIRKGNVIYVKPLTLIKDVEKWNKFREDHPTYMPNISGANLTGADLTGANLTGADLWYSDLTGANLTGANLFFACLYNANFSGACLNGTKLTCVCFSRTIFDTAHFKHIPSLHGLTNAKLQSRRCTCFTKLP